MSFEPGWDGLEGPSETAIDAEAANAREDKRQLALAFARCFHSAEGARVLAHLLTITRERTLGPSASDALLRHTEGQRQLVAYILALVERGRRGD